MPLLLLILGFLALLFLPSWWVRRIMQRYSQPEDRYQGTGAELARHLLEMLGMEHVGVEQTTQGDHYDPTEKMVRLSPANYGKRSLTAITVAAHEVGHAIQDYDGYRALHLRTQVARFATGLSRISSVGLLIVPLVALLLRAPMLGWLALAVALGGVLISALLHLVTLPVEWDASFGRALPLLEKTGILKPEDQPHARRILRAAAMTYVAQALVGLAAVWRWLRLPR